MWIVRSRSAETRESSGEFTPEVSRRRGLGGVLMLLVVTWSADGELAVFRCIEDDRP